MTIGPVLLLRTTPTGARQYVLVFSTANRTDAAFLQPEAFGKVESPEQDGERKQQSHG